MENIVDNTWALRYNQDNREQVVTRMRRTLEKSDRACYNKQKTVSGEGECNG